MRFLTFGLLSALVVTGCSRAAATPTNASFHPDASIREVMASMVSPGATAVWDSVSVTVGAGGSEENAPTTDEAWQAVRLNAIMMTEASNLLLMDGRHVAPPGAKSANPGDELEPEQIEALIHGHWPEWVARVNALHDIGLALIATIDKKDPDALSEVGGEVDMVCENCHLQFWYPTPE